uniref:Uncharacterized protein n=1 Tax=Haptolina ericina TaxID=156174 RepID=A0A7S3AVH5_9EUKA|eukprot:CAMPEP_0181189920 /NCGR_PEP_ID=MMETSP1096-20121128/11919_1 /TAXON_ID=156174 ORGANISM="Chrysochromulina ericina, Strain CCMP281" /NCGR_SAMPLE_ID=MMETSP1096 /ASSEMBLY_ACC=CAM_ASM_000453 /LENGTH=101 /DNA_ID=CAMNT_0023279105 /DNA_START=105 /DNA_END=410 /DNA_ORIENTATION=-
MDRNPIVEEGIGSVCSSLSPNALRHTSGQRRVSCLKHILPVRPFSRHNSGSRRKRMNFARDTFLEQSPAARHAATSVAAAPISAEERTLHMRSTQLAMPEP